MPNVFPRKHRQGFGDFFQPFDPQSFLGEGVSPEIGRLFERFRAELGPQIVGDEQFGGRLADLFRDVAFREFQQNRLTGGLEDLIGDITSRHTARQERLLGQFGKGAQNVQGRLDQLTQGITQGFGQRESDVLGFLDPRMAQISQRLTERPTEGLGFLDAFRGDVQGGFGELRGRALGTLEGSGEQAKKDIRQRFKERRGELKGDLSRRGLLRSTVGQDLKRAIDREEEDALARIEEDIRQERLSVETGIGGAELGARERLGLSRADLHRALTGEAATGLESLTRLGAATRGQLRGEALEAASQLGQGGAAGAERLLGAGVGLGERLSSAEIEDLMRLMLARLGSEESFLGDIGGMLAERGPRFRQLRTELRSKKQGRPYFEPRKRPF